MFANYKKYYVLFNMYWRTNNKISKLIMWTNKICALRYDMFFIICKSNIQLYALYLLFNSTRCLWRSIRQNGITSQNGTEMEGAVKRKYPINTGRKGRNIAHNTEINIRVMRCKSIWQNIEICPQLHNAKKKLCWENLHSKTCVYTTKCCHTSFHLWISLSLEHIVA